jgi:dienelactone hydrolase
MAVSSLRLTIVLAAALFAAPAFAQTELLPGLPDHPMRGPGAAKGAVIWNHGKAPLADASSSPIDGYTETLREAGWDIFRLNRKGMGDNQHDSPAALGEAVDKLHHDGYARIVLAGQSYGAWTSFLVAAKRDDLHAIIATAPAAYGTWDRNFGGYDKNARYLYDMVEEMKPTRVMIFLFARDDFDPGGRGQRLESILRERAIAHKLIDQPPDLAGHGSAHSRLFTGRYGSCIADFIDPEKDADKAACEANWGHDPTGDLRFSPDARVMEPGRDVPPGLAGLSGRWWGWYPNGREVEVVVTSVTADQATMLYGVGPGGNVDSKADIASRTATPGEGGIVSMKPHAATIILRPEGNGRATVIWKAAEGATTLEAVLRRVD